MLRYRVRYSTKVLRYWSIQISTLKYTHFDIEALRFWTPILKHATSISKLFGSFDIEVLNFYIEVLDFDIEYFEVLRYRSIHRDRGWQGSRCWTQKSNRTPMSQLGAVISIYSDITAGELRYQRCCDIKEAPISQYLSGDLTRYHKMYVIFVRFNSYLVFASWKLCDFMSKWLLQTKENT